MENHDGDPRVSPYPFNFSVLREGDTDPTLGKPVKWLIDSDDDYIVYVDDDTYVEWTMNSNAVLADAGDLLTRVGWLEAVEVSHLSEVQLDTYKRLIGEGVARLFEKNRTAASAALDTAEKWITARNQESARIWYLEGAAAGVSVAFLGFLGALRIWGLDALLHHREIIATAAFCGAVGALLSVLQRSGQTALDLAAGRFVHTTEGAARVLTGALGGLFVGLLLWSGYVLKDVSKNSALFLAVCLVAGLSERMVNSLAGSVEASTGLTLTKSNLPQGSAPPRKDQQDALNPADSKTLVNADAKTTLSKDPVAAPAPPAPAPVPRREVTHGDKP